MSHIVYWQDSNIAYWQNTNSHIRIGKIVIYLLFQNTNGHIVYWQDSNIAYWQNTNSHILIGKIVIREEDAFAQSSSPIVNERLPFGNKKRK